MAAIDKIYINANEAKEFINWINSGVDENFKEFFKEAGEISLKDFMYISSIEDLPNNDLVFPISNFPTLVEKWLYCQPGLPESVKNEIKLNYGIDSKEDEQLFLESPVDNRQTGNHVKILSRSGTMLNRNNYSITCIEVDNYYYINKWMKKHYPNENLFNIYKYIDEYRDSVSEYEFNLSRDSYWHCGDNWENILFKKKKYIHTDKSSSEIFRKCSLKSIIRKLTKKYKFPIGTIIKVFDFRYYGEIYIKIIK